MADDLEHQLAFDLLPLHAVDALEPVEAEFVASHVSICDQCSEELNRVRETVAHSLVDIAVVAPFWEDLLEAARDAATQSHSQGRDVWLEAVTLLGESLLDFRQELRRLAIIVGHQGQSLDAVLRLAVLDPEAKTGALRLPAGDRRGLVVLLPSGSGVLAPAGIDAASPGRTYQLWAVPSGPPVAISIGVLGSRLVLSAFQYVGPSTNFAITEEAEGGSATPGRTVLVAELTGPL